MCYGYVTTRVNSTYAITCNPARQVLSPSLTMSQPPEPSSSSSSVPKRSLNSQTVLEEDEYTAALSHIIARDFFPSLVHLDATNSYLDALETRDPQLIGASVRHLESVNATVRSTARPWQTPSETPYGVGPSETPVQHRGSPPASKRARYDTDNMSIDAFQTRYTSEDNASFTQILNEENVRRREKYGWAWDAQRRVEGQRAKALEVRERALIEMPESAGVREKMRIEAPAVPAGLITARGEDVGAGAVSRHETGEGGGGEEEEASVVGKQVVLREKNKEDEVVDVMAPKKDTRPAGVDSLRPVELVGQEHTCKGATKDDQAWKHSTPGTRRKPVLISSDI